MKWDECDVIVFFVILCVLCVCACVLVYMYHTMCACSVCVLWSRTVCVVWWCSLMPAGQLTACLLCPFNPSFRRVRINSQPEIIPLFAGSTKTGRNGVSSSGPTEKEVFLDEDIIVEDEVDLDSEEDHKEQDKEEFAMKQKAEEMVCTVLSKAIKAFL